MNSCNTGSYKARDHTHTDITTCNTEDPQKAIGIEMWHSFFPEMALSRRSSCTCTLPITSVIQRSSFNLLYTGGHFHCYLLDEYNFHLGVPGLLCCFYSICWWKML